MFVVHASDIAISPSLFAVIEELGARLGLHVLVFIVSAEDESKSRSRWRTLSYNDFCYISQKRLALLLRPVDLAHDQDFGLHVDVIVVTYRPMQLCRLSRSERCLRRIGINAGIQERRR